MKTTRNLVLLWTAVLLVGCSGHEMVSGTIDIKDGLVISPGVAFDIRMLKEVYGKPQKVDLESNALLYVSCYDCWENVLFGEREWSEAWYLVLRHTEDDYYYTGERYSHYEAARKTADGETSTINPDIWKSVREIEERCKRE